MKCKDCKNDAIQGRVRCLECLKKGREYSKDLKFRRRLKGLCLDCGTALNTVLCYVLCYDCRKKAAVRIKEWKRVKRERETEEYKSWVASWENAGKNESQENARNSRSDSGSEE